jgi:glycosyltransferase involved in cell wall biosynthesis
VRIALAITSYERPEALAAVLRSVDRQSRPPDEIIIADDGSGDATRSVIAGFMARTRTAARVVSQPHEGFRAARLRNLAIAAASADYLVFIDGDMLLHPAFIDDHATMARPGFFTQGVRVNADAALSARLLGAPDRLPGALSPGMGFLRRAYLLHSPPLSAAMRRAANAFVAVKSCNFAAWRQDLVRVNGFNEEMVGWGPEDKELCARLGHAGVRRQTLLFGGIAWHLHHPAASRDALPANLAVLDATRRQGTVRCAQGVDSHLRT